MIAGMFIVGGLDALQHPDTKTAKAEKVAPPVARTLGLPEDTTTLVRANGAVQVGAAALLAVGRFPRLASLILAGSLVPTTLAGHRFWEETDKQARTMQRTHFLKNVAMLGGLLLAAVDTEGRPSLGWRAHRAAERAASMLPIGSD